MGSYVMPLAWVLGRSARVPIVLDLLVSQFDTEVTDRARLSRHHPKAWLLWVVDFVAMWLADLVVVDTEAHQGYFAKHFWLSPKKTVVVPVGCRQDIFVPQPETPARDEWIVEFHGTYIPLQGVEYIIDAAHLVEAKDASVRFELTGDGQTRAAVEAHAKALHLHNVRFFNRTSLRGLAERVAQADLCLGIFGRTPKAIRVIPHKVYECLSCGKPTITEDSPAVRKLLHHLDGIYIVPPGDAAALADAILSLKNDAALRLALAARARELTTTRLTPRVFTHALVAWLEQRT